MVRKRKRFVILFGGRGSTKSMTIADLLLQEAQVTGAKTACFREYQNTIEDSVLSLLTQEVARLDLQGFDCQKNAILFNGEEVFKFRGLARNPEGVQSMHGFNYAWVEEAQTISARSLRALTPSIREEDSEIWMSANLRSMADPFAQRFFKPFEKELRRDGFYEDDLHLILWINYTDNPFMPRVLKRERAYDEKTMSKAEYNHVWLGETYDEVMGAIVPIEWFDAAIDAHKVLGFEPSGAKFAAFDPSDRGDPKGYCLRHGSVYLDICDTEEGDVNSSLDWAVDKALKAGADHFTMDMGGMGTGLKRQLITLLENTKCDYHLFNGAETAEHQDRMYDPVDGEDPRERRSNKDTFFNKRAQGYTRLADRFEKTFIAVEAVKAGMSYNANHDELISLSSDIKQLDEIRSEVCRIPKKPNNNGKKQIMSKLEMSKKPFELPSPNMSDSMMMNEFIPPVKKVYEELKFSGWG